MNQVPKVQNKIDKASKPTHHYERLKIFSEQ